MKTMLYECRYDWKAERWIIKNLRRLDPVEFGVRQLRRVMRRHDRSVIPISRTINEQRSIDQMEFERKHQFNKGLLSSFPDQPERGWCIVLEKLNMIGNKILP